MTTEGESLCQLYRRAVRESVRNYQPAPGTSGDRDFHDYLRRTYAESVGEMRRAQAAGKSPPPGSSTGLFVLACGLFTFGELDKATEVLEHLPGTGGIRKLALALPALLPLPSEADVLGAPDPVRQWLANNGQRLSWREAEGRYEFLGGVE
jgi:hypothetical protein